MTRSVFPTRLERVRAWVRENGPLITVLAMACAILLAVGSAFAWRSARRHTAAAAAVRLEYVALADSAREQLDSLRRGRWEQLGPHDVIIRRRRGR